MHQYPETMFFFPSAAKLKSKVGNAIFYQRVDVHMMKSNERAKIVCMGDIGHILLTLVIVIIFLQFGIFSEEPF